MKSNGYSNIKQNKQIYQIPQQQTSAIKSLRSIINETKIPLSDYINNQRSSIEKKVPKIQRLRTKTSYFERFKGMIGNGIIQKCQQQNFSTPNKINQQYENMQDENVFEFQKNNQIINKSQLYRQTITHNENIFKNNSRSKSIKQRSNIPAVQSKLNERLSFQPIKNVKTQQTIVHQSQKGLPPRPNIKNNFQQRKSQIRKITPISDQILPNTSRARINKQSNDNSYVKQQNSQPKQKTLDQMIQNIHSYRRLNFCKQQERRKQIIVYGKSFDKICQNTHFKQVQIIDVNPIQISEVLGNGAFSYVKVGILRGLGMNQKFAIKIYEKYKLIQPGRKNRVMKQIEILSSLNHPNITKLYCAYQNKREIHILFEQIQESITLQEYFKHMSLKFNDPALLIFIMKQTLKGLDYLHSMGIAHRDIKPDNILISFKDNIPVVKLIDFGFATSSSISNIHCGTPNFMAPELFKKQPYSPIKTDVWAFAVMFYYLLQSKYPFKGYNQKDLTRNICENKIKFQKTPIQIEQILSLVFQTNPDSRISSKQILNLLYRV